MGDFWQFITDNAVPLGAIGAIATTIGAAAAIAALFKRGNKPSTGPKIEVDGDNSGVAARDIGGNVIQGDNTGIAARDISGDAIQGDTAGEDLVKGDQINIESAVINIDLVAHAKWDERPLLLVIRREGAELTREQMLSYFDGKVVKWWIPDDVVFVDELPHTATGKLLKTKLRDDFKDHKLPGE